MRAKDRVIVKLNVSSIDEALTLITKLAPHVRGFEIGFQLMTSMFILATSTTEHTDTRRKIYRLFLLLGHEISKIAQLMQKAGEHECDSIVFMPEALVLVGGNQEQVYAMDNEGREVTKAFGSELVFFGREITHARGPIRSVKKAAQQAEACVRKINRYSYSR